MRRRPTWPVALTIAGSDSGGGAGIQADLKTFAALRVHGTSVITCITAQNPDRVLAIQAASPAMVRAQIEAVMEGFRPRAIKIGMLLTPGIIEVVAECLRSRKETPLIIDPVLVATSGRRLLQPGALKPLRGLLTCAALVTPNRDEAQALTGLNLKTEQHLRDAARSLHEDFGCAALVKGGHLRGGRQAVDIFYDGKTELLLSAPFTRVMRTHGTGCAYSAALAAYVARGIPMSRSVVQAKEFITQAIQRGYTASGHFVLNNLWSGRSRG